MAEKELQLARNRATRAANRGVVTKIIEESEEILENDATLHDVMRRSNRNFNIPPRANPGHLTIFCARGVGNLTDKAFPGVGNLTLSGWGGEN